MKKLLTALVISVLLVGGYFFYKNIFASETCAPAQQTECKSPIAVYEDPARIPFRNFVLGEMGDLTGKTVVDIGAGTGFFAFEAAQTAEKVIATELDPMFLNFMNKKKEEQNIANFTVLEADENQSELKNLEVDIAFMVYVFHYLDNPKMFLKKLITTIRPGGKIHIANAQLSSVIIKDYLEMVGFSDIKEASFSYPQAGCGDVKVQLISATNGVENLAGKQ